LTLIVTFNLSTQLVALISWVEGPFLAFLMLASESNFTTPQLNFFTPKLMTIASAWAIRGEYLPNGGVQCLQEGSPGHAASGNVLIIAQAHCHCHQNGPRQRYVCLLLPSLCLTNRS